MREMIFGKFRGATTLVAILTLTLTGGVLALWWLWPAPDPATASRAAIFRWLATADVSQLPTTTQLALVDRLETELQAGLPLDDLQRAGPSYHSMLAANAAWLKKLWFTHRAEQYRDVPSGERSAFLDARIQTVLAWSNLEAAFASGAEDEGSKSAAAAFFDDIESWIADEPDPQKRNQMYAAVHDGIVHWLSTRELADQPHDVRTRLALCIAEHLDGGLAVSSVAKEKTSQQRDLLRVNGILLMESWLVHQARQYAQLPSAEHSSFLDEQIDRVSGWSIWELLAASEDATDAPTKMGGLAQFPQLAQACVDRAAPDDKTKIERLISDVQARLLSRWLQRATGRG